MLRDPISDQLEITLMVPLKLWRYRPRLGSAIPSRGMSDSKFLEELDPAMPDDIHQEVDGIVLVEPIRVFEIAADRVEERFKLAFDGTTNVDHGHVVQIGIQDAHVGGGAH
jgi:hypothetical protein